MQHELTTQQAHIDSLLSYPGNPREGDIGAIAVSLQQNGQYRPIVVNKRNMTILAGNHTWKAAKYLGWETIAVTYVDVDDTQARKIVLADNRHNDLASYNDDVLAELLQQVIATDGIEGLLGTGFDGDDLDQLLADLAEPSETDWADALLAGAENDNPLFQQMTFILHLDQVEQVKEAIKAAHTLGPYDSENNNANGNGLARIAETFLTTNTVQQ